MLGEIKRIDPEARYGGRRQRDKRPPQETDAESQDKTEPRHDAEPRDKVELRGDAESRDKTEPRHDAEPRDKVELRGNADTAPGKPAVDDAKSKAPEADAKRPHLLDILA